MHVVLVKRLAHLQIGVVYTSRYDAKVRPPVQYAMNRVIVEYGIINFLACHSVDAYAANTDRPVRLNTDKTGNLTTMPFVQKGPTVANKAYSYCIVVLVDNLEAILTGSRMIIWADIQA